MFLPMVSRRFVVEMQGIKTLSSQGRKSPPRFHRAIPKNGGFQFPWETLPFLHMSHGFDLFSCRLAVGPVGLSTRLDMGSRTAESSKYRHNPRQTISNRGESAIVLKKEHASKSDGCSCLARRIGKPHVPIASDLATIGPRVFCSFSILEAVYLRYLAEERSSNPSEAMIFLPSTDKLKAERTTPGNTTKKITKTHLPNSKYGSHGGPLLGKTRD